MKKLLSLLLVCALLCGCSEQGAQTTTTTTTTTASTTTTTTTPQATTTTTTPQTTTTPETTTTSEPIQTEPDLGLSYKEKDETVIIAEGYEYSEDDKELQKLLSEKTEKINMYLMLEKFGYYATVEEAEKDGVEFSYEREIEGTPAKTLYILQNDEFPFNSIDEVKADINSLFAEDIANGRITAYFESEIPLLEEKDGRLYHKHLDGAGGYTSFDFSRSKVVSKTEDEIVFSFLMPEVVDNVLRYNAIEGILKYEDNEWKVAFSLCYPEWHDFAEVWGNT